jgi:hypothetical protein
MSSSSSKKRKYKVSEGEISVSVSREVHLEEGSVRLDGFRIEDSLLVCILDELYFTELGDLVNGDFLW